MNRLVRSRVGLLGSMVSRSMGYFTYLYMVSKCLIDRLFHLYILILIKSYKWDIIIRVITYPKDPWDWYIYPAFTIKINHSCS